MKHQSPSYSITMRLSYADQVGQLGRITTAIAEADGLIGAVDLVDVRASHITRDITVNARDVQHSQRIVEQVRAVPGVKVVRVSDRTFLLHLGGKIEVRSKVRVKTRDDLSMAYTPGVARVCHAIHDDPEAAFTLTIRRNTVAVVTDGSAVLGLGNIGPAAALPVMEGKAVLFKEFGGVDAFPICLDTQDADRIVEACTWLAPTFGGINLEDISSPRCVEIERRLIERLDIPVFHDDQHGTAIVVLAALENALKVVEKKLSEVRITLCGAGAAGAAIARLLEVGRAPARSSPATARGPSTATGPARPTRSSSGWPRTPTPTRVHGTLAEAVAGSDVFIGVSTSGVLHRGGRADHGARRRSSSPWPTPTPRSTRTTRSRRCRRDGHGAFGLRQPDQQRALLPGAVPRHVGRAGPPGDRRDEDRGRPGDRRRDSRGRPDRRLHHPQRVRPPGVRGGGQGGVAGGRGKRRGAAPAEVGAESGTS